MQSSEFHEKILRCAHRGAYILLCRLAPELEWPAFVPTRGGHGELNNHHHPSFPIVLTIAGFDPSCGAGIARRPENIRGATIVTASPPITALTVQSTQGVKAVHATPPATLRAQLEALAEDLQIAAVKIGMLGTRANAAVVAEFLDRDEFAKRRARSGDAAHARAVRICSMPPE